MIILRQHRRNWQSKTPTTQVSVPVKKIESVPSLQVIVQSESTLHVTSHQNKTCYQAWMLLSPGVVIYF